jgi:hypothetical protein
MAVWDAGTLSSVSGVLRTAVAESRLQSIGRITLEAKCAGARSADNPHATCEVAGAGNRVTETPRWARRGKPWIQTRKLFRATALVLDPTGISVSLPRRPAVWYPFPSWEVGITGVFGWPPSLLPSGTITKIEASQSPSFEGPSHP